MQTPTKVTLEGFYKSRREFLLERCVISGVSGRALCRNCGTRIKVQPVMVQIHNVANGQCHWDIEQFEAWIPYCASCEELPELTGCVHA